VRFKIKEGGGYLGGELWDRGGPEEAIACGGCVRERESFGREERKGVVVAETVFKEGRQFYWRPTVIQWCQ
jgi:hypothetical protein